MAAKILGAQLDSRLNVQTHALNILDLTTTGMEPSSSSQRHLFSNTLISSTFLGLYMPLYLEVHIMRDKVVFTCPYDKAIVQREEIEALIQTQTEVLEALNSMDSEKQE